MHDDPDRALCDGPNQLRIEEFPQLERWYEQLLARPAFERGLAVGLDLVKESGGMDEEARRTLFGQR